MAGQKKRATQYLTLEGLLEDVTYAELTILRRASYEYPEEVTVETFSKKETSLIKPLIDRQLLEANQDGLGYIIRCTERGELAAGYITKRTVEKLCKRLDDLIAAPDLGIVADSLPLLMYRVMNDYRSLEVFVSIADHHKMFDRVSRTYERFREARKAAQEHHRNAKVKIERFDAGSVPFGVPPDEPVHGEDDEDEGVLAGDPIDDSFDGRFD